MAVQTLSSVVLRAVIDELSLPLLLLSNLRVIYVNPAAERLSARLKQEHGTQLRILIRDHVEAVGADLERGPVVSLVTAENGETFYVHVNRLPSDSGEALALVTVRDLAPDRNAFKRRYHLSEREAQVVDLVLRGLGNRDIGTTLGITPGTTKKHLTSVFNKVGVDSRTQLISKLA